MHPEFEKKSAGRRRYNFDEWAIFINEPSKTIEVKMYRNMIYKSYA